MEVVRPVYVGKEANSLEEVEHLLVEDEDEIMNRYDDAAHDPFVRYVVPVLRGMPREQVLRVARLHPDSVKRILAGRVPHGKTAERLALMAVEYARSRLRKRDAEIPKNAVGILRRFTQLSIEQRTCPECGKLVPSKRAAYCSAVCRMQASRRRRGERNGVGGHATSPPPQD